MNQTTIKLNNNQAQTSRRHIVSKHGQPIPKVPLYLAGLVIVFSITLAVGARFYGVNSWQVETGAPVESRTLAFTLHSNDTITVRDPETGSIVEEIGRNTDGFLHGALRALKRHRMVKGAAADAPYRIDRNEDGSITFLDTATKKRLYVRAYGKDNAAAIARFLEEKPLAPAGNGS